ELDGAVPSQARFPAFGAAGVWTVAVGVDHRVEGRVVRALGAPLAGELDGVVKLPEPFQALAALHARVHESRIEGGGAHKAGLGGGEVAEPEEADALQGV